ncbi:CoA pyrophosphatase [soil metagenome]
MQDPTLRRLATRLMPAAVLVALFERAGAWRTILTERATMLAHHPGQIAFPGGRIEMTDAGPLQAALREAEEEIGLPPMIVETAGYLATRVTLTGYAVVPVVAFVRSRFSMRLDPAEVSTVFDAPLAHLLEPANRREVCVGGSAVWEILYGERRIWGATAAILVDLSQRLAEEAI